MKRINVWIVSVIMVFACASFATASAQVYDDDDGNLTRTALSSEALQEPYIQALESAGMDQSGYTVTVVPDASEFPDITMTVSLHDANGYSIGGLTADDLNVLEQSTTETTATLQELTCFNETVLDGAGISFAIAVDISSSMSGTRLVEAKDVAAEFIGNSNGTDRVSLVTFSSGGMEEVVFPVGDVNTDSDGNEEPDIVAAINGLRSSGRKTAVFDGIAMAIDSIAQEPSPKAVIVFSDGITNNDRMYGINSLIEKANNAGVIVYSIAFHSPSPILENIAQLTGGECYYTESPLNVADLYDAIASGIRAEFVYTLCYTTHNPVMDGTTRTVTVEYGTGSGTGFYTANFTPVITLDGATQQLGNQTQAPGTALAISGDVTDMDAAEDPDQVLTAELFYRQAGAAEYTSLPLVLGEGENGVYSFSQEIPAEDVLDPGIEYYLYASDQIRSTFEPVAYDTQPFTITVSDEDTNGGDNGECPSGDCDPGGGCFISSVFPKGNNGAGGIYVPFAALLFFCAVFGAVICNVRKRQSAGGRKKRVRLSLLTSMILAAVLLVFSQNVQAEENGETFVRPGAFTMSPLVGGYVFDSDQDIEEGPIFGLGLGYNFTENWAVRLYGHFGTFDHPYWDFDTCGCVTEDVDASVLQADLVYHLWPGSRFVPYLAAGAGYTDLDFDNTGGDSSGTLNYGGGIKYFMTPNVALKANVRHIFLLDDSRSNMMANVGLEFQFGGSKPAPVTPPPAPVPVPVVEPPEPEAEAVPPVVAPEPETLVLTVRFKLDDATLDPAYYGKIEQAVQFMNRHPDVNAMIEGHTCSLGSEAYNMNLSRRRAESVKTYMIENFNVDGTRLITTGYGESRPEHDNATPEGRQLNRRVVIQLEEE